MSDVRFAICDLRSKQQRRRRSRRAFTFLEVLFAVIVLGIGFIMVAAMFPAALKQTQASVEDVSASSAWLDIARRFTELAKNQVPQAPAAPGATPQPIRYVLDQILPASGSPPSIGATNDVNNAIVYSFGDPRLPGGAPARRALWDFVRGNIILEEDPRFACVPMFRRRKAASPDLTANPMGGESTAEIYLVAVRSRVKDSYDASDLDGPMHGMPKQPTGQPKLSRMEPVRFDISINPADMTDPDGPYLVVTKMYERPGQTANTTNNLDENMPLAPGAFVIVSAGAAKNIGHIYRLGQRVNPSDPTRYYLAPDAASASDIFQQGFGAYGGTGLVVGRGFNPNTGLYEGPVQDIAVVDVPVTLR